MSTRSTLKTLALVTALAIATPAFAATVMVGGAPMFPNKTIVDNAVNSADHTTLVAAVKAAGLVDTLEGPGPITYNDLKNKVKKGNGAAMLKTVSGGTLWAMMNGPSNIVLKDEKGDVADITTYDVLQSNGVIHSIDKVLLPK